MDSLNSLKNQSWLSYFLRGILILSFFILFAKVVEAQIIKGNYYRNLSEENRIRHIPLPAPRGRILARGGEVLVGNNEMKRQIVFPQKGGYEFSDDLTDAGSEEMVTIYKRRYFLGDKFGHVSGFLGEVDAESVGKIDPSCPNLGPRPLGLMIGKTGLEEEYQCILSGIPGEELVEVDSMGKKIRTLGRREPTAGRDITTTIDYGLQEQLALEMGTNLGGAVVTDMHGQVLALYSTPSFDPNLFTEPPGSPNRDSKKISELLTNENKPFFNRVIGGLFHPGSVFKPLVAIAALSEKVIDRDFRFTDTGTIEVKTLYGNFSYANWYFTQYGGTEGEIDLSRALARSTDTFFYKTGEYLGPEKIAQWSEKFGLDKASGIDLPGEVSGLVPSPEWKEKVKKETWFLGNTYHFSIGQGDLAVTPLEINTMIAGVASGQLCTPRLLVDSNEKCSGLNLKKEDRDFVREGMKEACAEGGTAYTFFDFASKTGHEVACKTGTAETGESEDTHAWFTFFAPAETPEITTTILVEKGGEGSKVAGPIARKIADYYFAR